MLYTVHWKVNDGRNGYPNIVSEISSDIMCRTYKEAIRAHSIRQEVNQILSISELVGGKGKINGRSYRDFKVDYLANNVTDKKELYLSGEVVSKIIRVFGSYSGKSESL